MEREAFLQDALARSERENHLEKRARVLEEALQRYPQEPRLERQLSFLKELTKRVAGVVNDAHARERAEKYDAALEQWSIVRSIYPQYPGLEGEVARVQQLREQQRAANRSHWLQKIQSILVTADYERASAALQDAQREFPDDRAFADIEKRLQEGLKLRAKAQKVLSDAEKAFAKRQWQKGAETVQRACEIAGHDPAIRDQSLMALLKSSQTLVESDWQMADMLADHAAQLQPASPLLAPVKAKIANSKRNQIVSQYADKAKRAQVAGDLQAALQEIGSGLFAYPGEPRLLDLKTQIETRVQQVAEERRRQQELEKEKARQAEIERQKDVERRQREEAEARKRELEREQREEAEARQREIERKRREEMEREQARQLEARRQQELEEKRRQEAEARQKELERKRQQELEAEEARQKALEQERVRELELQKQRELARQQEAEKARERERERARALELEHKKEQDRRRQEEVRKAQKRTAKEKLRAKPPDTRTPSSETAPGPGFATSIFAPAPAPVDAEARPVAQDRLATPAPAGAPGIKPAWQTALSRIPLVGHLGILPVLGIGAALVLIIAVALWKILSPSPANLIAFEINTSPPGATITIKEAARECTTPNCKLKLAPGSYDLVAELPGYQTASQTFSVGTSAPHSLAITLSPSPVVTRIPEEPGTPTHAAPASPFAEIHIAGAAARAQVFMDGNPVGTINRRGSFSSQVPAGTHEIKIVDGKRVSRIITRQFVANSRVDINSSDLQPPSSTTTNQPSEADDWRQVKDSRDPEAVQSFLQRFPNSAFRQEAESKLEDLYWTRAVSTNSVAGFREYLNRYPNASHSQAAQSEIAKLDFQALENSRDGATLEDFLRRYPSGGYHDQIASRLDDLSWQKTSGNDVNSLRSYVQRFPNGKHTDEANRDIALLTRPPDKPRTPEPPRVQPPPAPVVDDRKAVLDVLQQYQRAYEDENITELKRIWPGMTQQQLNKTEDFFRTAGSVHLKYEVKGNPEIAGDQASIRFLQTLSFSLNGKRQNPNSFTVIMTMKKANSSPGSPPAWTIENIR